MIRPLLLCLVLVFAPGPAGAIPTVQPPASEIRAFERARRLIEVTRAEEALTASALESLDAQLAALDLPEGTGSEARRDRFRTLFRDEVLRSLPEVTDALAYVWAMHFGPDELDQLIAFYQSPLGRKVLARMPAVMRQAQEIGARWGERVGERALRRFEDDAASH